MRLPIAVPLLLAALLLSPPAASAQTLPAAPAQMPVSKPVPEKTVTINIIHGDLQSAMVQMEQRYGIKYIVQDGVEAHCVMNVNISDVPLSQAMRFIASAVNAQVTQNADSVYVFSPAPAASLQRPAQAAPQARFSGSFDGSPQGFSGFGPFKPSNALWYTHWLDSLGWKNRTNRNGTTGRPSLGPKTPETSSLQPSGVRRIFAL